MNALQFLNHGLKSNNNNKGRSTYAFMNKKDLKSKRDKLIKRINKRKKEKDQTTETTTATKE
jgi:hypothetical protein